MGDFLRFLHQNRTSNLTMQDSPLQKIVPALIWKYLGLLLHNNGKSRLLMGEITQVCLVWICCYCFCPAVAGWTSRRCQTSNHNKLKLHWPSFFLPGSATKQKQIDFGRRTKNSSNKNVNEENWGEIYGVWTSNCSSQYHFIFKSILS
jgi:hypothetical protein